MKSLLAAVALCAAMMTHALASECITSTIDDNVAVFDGKDGDPNIGKVEMTVAPTPYGSLLIVVTERQPMARVGDFDNDGCFRFVYVMPRAIAVDRYWNTTVQDLFPQGREL